MTRRTTYLAGLLLLAAPASWAQTCVTVPAEGTTAIIGTPCHFPFEWQGVNYTSCTTIDSFDGQPWCFTEDGYWGACVCDGSVPCVTEEGLTTTAAAGTACSFPFEYKGVQYDACTVADNFGIPWCATEDGSFGNCLCDGGFGYGVYPEPDGYFECTTTESAFSTAPEGSFCSFPFTYNGVEYDDCTDADNFGVPWCSTEDGLWGDCDCQFVSTLSCNTTATEPYWPSTVAPIGSQCVFPFNFNGEDVYNCVTTDAYPTPFCFTSAGEWGNCVCEGDPTNSPTSSPTRQPTASPTRQPTSSPTQQPTQQPTTQQPTAAAGEPEEEPTGFDFGGCGGGDGAFTTTLDQPGTIATLGTIPAGKAGVYVALEAVNDLDVVLYDTSNTTFHPEGRAIVAWCNTAGCNRGLLDARLEETVTYRGMVITYSGFNGVGGNRGHEFIRVEGTIPSDLLMGVLAFRAGTARVTYSWATTDTPCCNGVEACGGEFSAPIELRALVDIGEIPPGKRDLYILLESNVDVDVQLYDLDDTADFPEGAAVIAWCNTDGCNGGVLGQSPTAGTAMYNNVQYEYSGWRGVGGQRGHEYIRISGVTNTRLMMKAYGFRAGDAQIVYTYFELPDMRV